MRARRSGTLRRERCLQAQREAEAAATPDPNQLTLGGGNLSEHWYLHLGSLTLRLDGYEQATYEPRTYERERVEGWVTEEIRKANQRAAELSRWLLAFRQEEPT